MKEINLKIDKIREKGEEVSDKFREQTAGYITTALGIVAGLAWNDAIKSLIEFIFPLSKDTLMARFIYAALITVVVILISRSLLTVLGRRSSDSKKKRNKGN